MKSWATETLHPSLNIQGSAHWKSNLIDVNKICMEIFLQISLRLHASRFRTSCPCFWPYGYIHLEDFLESNKIGNEKMIYIHLLPMILPRNFSPASIRRAWGQFRTQPKLVRGCSFYSNLADWKPLSCNDGIAWMCILKWKLDQLLRKCSWINAQSF